jgi:hypothetical protein
MTGSACAIGGRQRGGSPRPIAKPLALPSPRKPGEGMSPRKVLRRGRIFALLREGWAYDKIARNEGLTAERIRQIVREALEKRLLLADPLGGDRKSVCW